MVVIRSDTEMTGTSSDRATRSAVRWRVPVSEVGRSGSGTRWTLARDDASQVGGQDDRAVHLGQLGEALRAERGVEQEPARADVQTSGPSPTTISAPMPAWRMRLSPSRSGWPGATDAIAWSRASLRRVGTRPSYA